VNYKKYFIFSFSLFIVLLVIYFSVSWTDFFFENIPLVQEKRELIEIPIQEISAVAVVGSKDKYGLIQKGSEIQLVPPDESEKYSQSEFQAFIYDISHLSYQRKLEKEGLPEEYGFDAPLSQLTVFSRDGDKIRLILGKKDSLDDGYYLKAEEDSEIYVVSDDTARIFLKAPEDFRERRVLPGIGIDKISELESVILSFPSDQCDSFEIINQGSAGFVLVQPIINTTDFETVLSDLLFPLLNLTSEHRFREEEITQSLNIENLRVLMRINGSEYDLSFYSDGSNGLYIRNNSSDNSDLFYFTEYPFRFDEIRYMDLLDYHIYHCNISEITSINLHDYHENKDYSLEISGQSVNMTALLDGVSVSHEKLMDLYSVIVETGISRKVSPSLTRGQLDNIRLLYEIEIRKKTGSIDSLYFFNSDDDDLYLAVNGTVNFMTNGDTVQRIRKGITDTLQ